MTANLASQQILYRRESIITFALREGMHQNASVSKPGVGGLISIQTFA